MEGHKSLRSFGHSCDFDFAVSPMEFVRWCAAVDGPFATFLGVPDRRDGSRFELNQTFDLSIINAWLSFGFWDI